LCPAYCGFPRGTFFIEPTAERNEHAGIYRGSSAFTPASPARSAAKFAMGRFGLPGREMALVPQRAGEAKRMEKKSAHRRQYELR